MARILEIRYATSWDPAVLHYGTQGGVDEKWKDVEMQVVAVTCSYIYVNNGFFFNPRDCAALLATKLHRIVQGNQFSG